MWEAIASNRRRSWVLIGVMGALLVLLGAAIGLAIDPEAGGAVGAVAAVVIWLVLFLIAMSSGDSLLLASARAREIQKRDAPRLWNVVEEMTIAAGLPKMPRVFIIDDESPNAFAVGRRPEHAAVAITSGLLKRLNRDELQGVIAHEIGHIKNLDIRFMTLAAVMLGSITLLADFFFRSMFYGGVGRRSSSSKGGKGQAVVILLAILVAILAPICAQLLYFACSRRREFLADASGARFTRYPEGLASALEKLAVLATGAKSANRALAPLYIVNPLGGLAAASLFSTHPPTDLRIRILRSMGGRAGYVDYEAAYKKLSGSGAHLIDSRTLSADTGVAAREPTVERDRKEDAVERVREVSGLLDRMADFIPIACVCGVHIKVPPGLARSRVPCPRCGRRHEVPHAERVEAATAAGAAPAGAAAAAVSTAAPAPPAPLRYERRGDGWESFRCECGKVLQLSPEFIAPSVTCRNCGSITEVAGPRSRR